MNYEERKIRTKAFLARLRAQFESAGPVAVTQADADEVQALGIGRLDLQTKQIELSLDYKEHPWLPAQSDEERIERAVRLWTSIHQHTVTLTPWTAQQADEMAVLGMGEIDVKAQRIRLEPGFRDGLRRLFQNEDMWEEFCRLSVVKVKH